MLVRTILWGTACALALVGCSSEKTEKGSAAEASAGTARTAADEAGATNATTAKAAAAVTDGKPEAAGKADKAAAPTTTAAGATTTAPGTTAAATAAAATAAGAATPPGATKPAAGEQPLLAAKDPPEVEELFPNRKRPSAPLPEPMQKQIRYKLREVSKAPIALRDAIYLPREDGSAEVVVIYELSVYEDCMKQGGSRKEARARCLPELQTISDYSDGESQSTEVRLNRDCRTYGVAHASFAAPGKSKAGKEGKEGEGGVSRVAYLALPEANCELRSLEQFFLDDVDRDGRPELVLDAIAAREIIQGHRRGESVEVEEERLLWVIELGNKEREMSEQLQLAVAKSSPSNQRTFWVDLNRDGRPDLVQVADCESNGYEEDPDVCDDLVIARTWHVYDRELDRWIDDEASPTPAKAPAPAPTPAKAQPEAPAAPADAKPATPATTAATAAAGGAQ